MTEEATPKRIVAYMTPNGKEPFVDWLNDLRDVIGRKLILARISRLQDGNYSDCEPVGEGVSELRMFFGGGYRVYIGERGNDLVILLCGGDKDSQDKDYARDGLPPHTPKTSLKYNALFKAVGRS